MINVLYVGNYLKGPKRNPTYMFTLGPLLQDLGYQLYYTSSKNNKFWRLIDMLTCVTSRSKKTQIVLIDTYSSQNFYYAFLVAWFCRRLGLPYIPILHGGELPNRLKHSPSLSQKLFNGAYTNVAPSAYLEHRFKESKYTNVIRIPNAITLKVYPFKKREQASLNLLWVRRLQELYNPLMALKVLKILKDKGFKAKLCMVGSDFDGSLDTLKQYAKKYQLEVKFTGYLPKDSWLHLSQDYDIFLNTTNADNTPISVIEVMALGLAVVSTDVGGLPYLINNEKNGLLVTPDNSKAMADAILKLYQNPDLFQNITKVARKKVEAFDVEKVQLQWKELIEGAV